MNLDNVNVFYQSYLQNYRSQLPPPATYQQSQEQDQILLPNRNTRVDITITTNKYTIDDFHLLSNGDDSSSSLNGGGGVEKIEAVDISKTSSSSSKDNDSTSSNGSSSNVMKGSENGTKEKDFTTDLLSPFDEQAEWAKISEIMESFGSSLVS